MSINPRPSEWGVILTYRRRSTLFLILRVLILAVFGGNLIFLAPVVNYDPLRLLREGFHDWVFLLLLLGLYAVASLIHYRVIVLTIAVTLVILLIISVSPYGFTRVDLIYFMAVPILLVGMFFGKRSTLGFAALSFAALIALVLLFPEVQQNAMWGSHLAFVVVLVGMALISNYHFTNLAYDQNRQLAAIETRYRNLLENSPEAVVVHSQERILYANRACLRLFGCERVEELHNQTLLGLIPAHLFDSPTILEGETVLEIQGQSRILKYTSAWMFYEGQPARHVMLQNVTCKKQREWQLKMIQQAVDSVSDAITISHMDGTSIYVNPAFTDLLGYTLDTLQNLTPQTHLMKEIDQLPHIFEALQEKGFWTGELTLVSITGEEIPFLVQTNIIRDENQQATGILSVSHDLRPRNALRLAAEALGREQIRNQSLEIFVGDMSHDLKTPLSILQTKSYLLSRYLTTEDQKRHLQGLQGQIERLTVLINDLLTMIRLENPHQIPFNILDLSAILKKLALDFSVQSEAQGIQFQDILVSEPMMIQGNESELLRAFSNLLENAIRYTPAQGRIILRLACQGEKAVCTVQDTGIGMTVEEVERIFERFYRAESARQLISGGTGLGLPITQEIIRAHQGEIQVESLLGEGSVFKVILPLA